MIPLCRWCEEHVAVPMRIPMYSMLSYEQGMLKPDGHTVSVSDLFFIAHSFGMLVRRPYAHIHACLLPLAYAHMAREGRSKYLSLTM